MNFSEYQKKYKPGYKNIIKYINDDNETITGVDVNGNLIQSIACNNFICVDSFHNRILLQNVVDIIPTNDLFISQSLINL